MPENPTDDPAQPINRLKLLETAMNALPIGVAIMNMSGTPVLVNHKFREMYQIDDDQMANFANLTFADMLDQGLFQDWKEDPRLYFERLGRTLSAGRDHIAEVEIGDKVIAVHDRPLGDGLLLSTQEDITSRVKAERSVAYMAHHDPLTDLPNRAAFQARLNETLTEARAKNQPFALLSVDLDRFKDVNDIFGHAVGDALLQEVAHRFRDVAGDLFSARLGGDEFTLLSTGGNQPARAATMAERLFNEAAGEIEVAGRPLLVSLSIGVAVYPSDGEDAATLLNNADAALYRAKAEGRGVVRFYEKAMDERIHKHRRLQADLRLALAHDELRL